MLMKLEDTLIDTASSNGATIWSWPEHDVQVKQWVWTVGLTTELYLGYDRLFRLKDWQSPEEIWDQITHELLARDIICKPLTISKDHLDLPPLDSPCI